MPILTKVRGYADKENTDDGSEADEGEVFAGDDQYSIDDNDDEDHGSQFTSHIVVTKLSGRSKERLSYNKNKIPRAPPAMIDIVGEIEASDDEEVEEPCSMPHSSSDRQLNQHKKSKERHLSSSMTEVEDMPSATNKRQVFFNA
ncbi:hypothetical protein PISMIDRAFT_13461 [Pisolithus microcarpus 441]|uniref:Uncharacterized protein n=1 Tax=Pisolithus microcarpus 441 TaxID=765257 RepID=A0A0C9YSN6_9AGAM|nr:hypothetical protein BKA83DRAFT_13461 [Pisolithus microcarpus]KIK19721.1 hypothetical protein PISMIDRAFT_13461 [Pisolithus microcarpus 441]